MPDNSTLSALQAWCRGKPAFNSRNDRGVDFNILGEFLGGFARFEPKKDPTTLLLRCYDPIREELEGAFPGSISLSSRMKWKTQGWHWTDIQLNGPISMETLKKLIDDSYQIVLDGFTDDRKAQVALVARALAPADLLDELLALHALAHRRAEILQLRRPCLLLKTLPTDPGTAHTSRSRIGGSPDLPPDMPWPKHAGKPLAFLAQVDLAEVAAVASLPDLPRAGLLCLFSVYGWQDPDGADPLIPDGPPAEDWTQIYFIDPSNLPAQPRKTPSKVAAFPAATVQPISIFSLPCAPEEPAIAALGLSGQEAQTLADLANVYNDLLGYQLGHPPRHLLMGYADYVQTITDGVAAENLKLLFQIASDPHTNMCWGDGGYLYFFIKPENLNPLDLWGVVADYQCG